MAKKFVSYIESAILVFQNLTVNLKSATLQIYKNFQIKTAKTQGFQNKP